jgi:hypothetical protein
MSTSSPTVLVIAAIALAVACSSSCSSVLANYASKNRNPPPSASTVSPTTSPAATSRPAQPGGNRIGGGAPNPLSKTLPPGGGTGNTVRTSSSYHPDFSTNACGVAPDPSGNNTAISETLCRRLGVPVTGPGSATCGRKLIVTNERTKQSVTVTVLDRRGDGEGLGLDMQTEAFNKIDADKEGVRTGKHSNLSVRWAS